MISPRVIKVAMLGFGSVGQSFARLLLDKEEELKEKYNTVIKVVAITTKTRGIMVDAWGIDLERALWIKQNNDVFPIGEVPARQKTALEVAQTVEYDVLIEMTPLEYASGRTATEHVKAALERGKHVICTNKGPVAWHYEELCKLAEKNNVKFRYETTILDGTPLFSIVRENLKLCNIIEVKGILSRTLNYYINGLEHGQDPDEIIKEGKARGIVEADPQNDLKGHESLVKVVALANALMGANLTPKDISDDWVGCGETITLQRISEAAERGNVIKYICRAYRKDGRVYVSAGPEEISKYDSYASVSGTSLAVSITTDLMGTMTIIEEASDIEQTGYGVFSDLLSIIEA